MSGDKLVTPEQQEAFRDVVSYYLMANPDARETVKLLPMWAKRGLIWLVDDHG